MYPLHIPLPVVYPYTSSSTFGAGSGPIFLTHLNCIGNEQTLLECSSSYPHPYYYSHGSDAGVQCEHRRHQYSGKVHHILLVSLPTYLLYLTTKFSTDGTLHLCMFNSYQVALMAPFDWLVDSPLMKAQWRSVSMECGGQCVMIAGVPVMPKLCADS